MRSGRAPLFVLLASALVFLLSLFVPWIEARSPGVSYYVQADNSQRGLIGLLTGGHVEGWVSGAGDVAILLVIAIVLATIAIVRRPQLSGSLPIGGLGVALGYFAAAVAIDVHRLSGLYTGGYTGTQPTIHRHWSYGFYLGLASGGIALLSAIVYRRKELFRSRDGVDLVPAGLGLALLVAFLLPWSAVDGPGQDSVHGIEVPPAAVVALGLILGAGWLHGVAGRRRRLLLAIATAVLTAGAAGAVASFGSSPHYGTWLVIAVGCAVALVAVEAVRALPLQIPALPRGQAAARPGAALLLIVVLFLPWHELHAQGVSGHGIDGWYSSVGTAAGALCLVLLATLAVPALESYVLAAVVAIVIFVSAAATEFREETFFYRVTYGTYFGFAAAGALLIAVLLPLRPVRLDRERALPRAVPLVAAALCVVAVVLPLWFVLPERWTYQAEPFDGWFAVPAVLIGLYLVRLWALQIRGPARTGLRLTVAPLVLLTLTALELIRFRKGDVIWGGIIVVGLCLLLAVCGRIEERGGFETFPVSDDVWRVDRLPEPES